MKKRNHAQPDKHERNGMKRKSFLPFASESDAHVAIYDLERLNRAYKVCKADGQTEALADFIMQQALHISDLDEEAYAKKIGDSYELRFIFAVVKAFLRISDEIGKEPIPTPDSIIGYWMQALTEADLAADA